MFARRRSSLSLDRLTCLNIAFLTCCLFVIGHVSSMSLDRLGRQYQQQNDKQLKVNEFTLPEAESEMLQSDMELVPALDGNSDMYLLVPASTAGQEQNLQTLTESNKIQNFDNVESNSDMLMMESEDTPAMQILELPGHTIETKIGEEIAINNKLNQLLAKKANEQIFNDDKEISDSMINTIAEAAQEIKNEIENEWENSKESLQNAEFAASENAKQEEEISSSNEFKDNEKEDTDSSAQDQGNLEQEMIGVVMEGSNEPPAASLKIEQETKEDDKDMQAEELESANKETQSAESSYDQSVEREKTETELLKYKTDQGEELENPIGNNEHKNVTATGVQDVDEMDSFAASKIQSEAQEVQKHLIEEEIQPIQDTYNDNKIPSLEEPQADEHIKVSGEETLKTSDETQVNLELLQTDDKIEAEHSQANVKTQSIADLNEIAQDNDKIQTFFMISELNDKMPLNVQSLEETQDIVGPSKNDDDGKLENLEELENAVNADKKHTAETDPNFTNFMQFEESDKLEPMQLSAESQIVEEFNNAAEESQVSDPFKDDAAKQEQLHNLLSNNEEESAAEEQEIEPDEEGQQAMEVQYVDKIQGFENDISNLENTDIQAEEAEPTHKTEQVPVNTVSLEEYKPIKETQYVAESLNFNNDPTIEEAQMAEEIQNVEDVQNLKTAEESAYEVEAVSEAQSAEYSHAQEVEKVQPDEHLQSIEEYNILDKTPSADITQNIEENQNIENMQFIDDFQAAGVQQPAAEKTEIAVGDLRPMVSAVNMESPFEVNQPLLPSPDFSTGQQELNPVDVRPEEIPIDEILTVESYKPLNEESIEFDDNKNENLQKETTEIQKQPFEDLSNNFTNESESIQESTSILTTIVQAPTNQELTQQQIQHEQLQEQKQKQQSAIVETFSSTTLKPFNVLDSVLNYVNASFMNQMNNDNNSNNKNKNNNIDEVKEDKKVFNSKLRRYDGAQVWRIVVQNEKERKLADELQSKFDGQLWKEVKQELDYLLKPQVLADAEHHVRTANLTRIILIDNLQKVIEVENPPAEEIAQLQNRNGCRLTWQAYHRLDDIHAYFEYLNKTYPDICSVETIGYSLERRPLKILKISNGNVHNPGIWIDGGMHAREWVSPAVVTYIANQIVEGWDDMPDYMRNINWYIHAVANPDGYEYSHTTDRLWRKNKRSHGRACPGVDLNRNFGYKWGGKGTSANPCSQTYRGVKAFSEPETFYISKFISHFRRDTFKAYLSFHSYGQYILYPWGYDSLKTNDTNDLDLVAREAGTIITKSTGAKFTVGSSATTLYAAAGGSDDWAKGIAGIKYSYTIEMGDTGRYGFILPASHIVSNGKNGLTFVQTVAKAITVGKNGRRLKLKAFKTH